MATGEWKLMLVAFGNFLKPIIYSLCPIGVNINYGQQYNFPQHKCVR